MICSIEIALKKELNDAKGTALKKKADSYFGITIDDARCIDIVTIEAGLDQNQLEKVKDEIFTNPVTQVSSLNTLDIKFDWCIWIGFRPGVKDNAGATAKEAVQDHLGITFKTGEDIYTSQRFCISAKGLKIEDVQ
ncbi:phosphoribosylformylglycinamidine synthase, partial [bacterium]|nr:phosphoribosylformylglycinamidine synthase [bacterium]